MPAQSGDRLAMDTTYSADLDGDDQTETVRVDGASGTLTIGDTDVTYRSRDKWRVMEAHLGDTDQNGLLEVVTLLDDDDGRHLGLFAYFGREYRERLVTQEFVPRPVSLRVLPGDLLEIKQEPGQSDTEPRVTVYRWNGFGFTVVDPAVGP